jgi:hypothetical protein
MAGAAEQSRAMPSTPAGLGIDPRPSGALERAHAEPERPSLAPFPLGLAVAKGALAMHRTPSYLAAALALLAAACSAGSDPGPGGSSDVRAPSFSGDCTSYLDDQGDVRSFSWSQAPLTAKNCSDDGGVCALVESQATPAIQWLISAPGADVGVATPIDPEAGGEGVDLALTIQNTEYQNALADHPGEIGGTLTVRSFDPGAGKAELVFDHATLLGFDAVYSGTYRCAVDGVLSIESFGASRLGTKCHTDQDCGGAMSGRVCSDESFTCVEGCHAQGDCPAGTLCEAGTCAEDAGATPDEIAACRDACHELAFFTCISAEASCKELCGAEQRAAVQTFTGCVDDAAGACDAGAACFAAFE